ncbi:winged helix-turn-helix domain-containing protein [Methanolobus sp. ZRKC5]|uniref:helix-turn-helix transcriptional regulator n=1 Tax=unclassified Methanolobus TaxID=2629569 RepID=UPI00313AF0F5
MSEKRKNLMLFLRDGPREMGEILEVLNVTRHALLPQIKILSENRLVIKEKDVCRLSEIGAVIVRDMLPLVGTLKVLEDNFDYWTKHELSSIPPHLLRRIRELEHCEMIEPDLNDMFELNKDLIEESMGSNFVMGATAFLHPSFPSFLLDLVKSNIDVSIIMTENALGRHKVDYGHEFKMFLKNNNAKLFVYPGDMKLASLFLTDNYLMMCLFDENGNYDRKDLVFCNSLALHWGKELFDYYLSRSYPILDL